MKKVISIVTTSMVVLSVLPTLNVSAQNFDTKEVKITQKLQKNDDLSYGIIGSEYEEIFLELVDLLESTKYTRMSDQAILPEVQRILNKRPNNVMTRDAIDTIAGFFGKKLNPEEKKLYDQYQVRFLRCMANAYFAEKYWQEEYSVWGNDNGNAFKHAIWNYWMAASLWEDFAKRCADAHELGDYMQDWKERLMDLMNNDLGRKLSKENGFTLLHGSFKSITKKAIGEGKGWIIRDNRLMRSDRKYEK